MNGDRRCGAGPAGSFPLPMSNEPTVGSEPHARPETLADEKHTPCGVCADPAAGYDARRGASICRPCAAAAPPSDGTNPAPTRESGDDVTNEWYRNQPLAITELNAFRRDLLAAIALYRPADGHEWPYGHGVRTVLEDLHGREIHDTQLYPALEDLVDAGLLRPTGVSQDQRTNYYAFTDRGRAALSEYARLLLDAAGAVGGMPELQHARSQAVWDTGGPPALDPPADDAHPGRDGGGDTKGERRARRVTRPATGRSRR